MATMNVKDADDQTVVIEKPLAPGRAAAAASRPVALSTEDLAALTAIANKIIAAPATAANQATALTLLQGIIDAIGGIPGGGGDASAANQVNGNDILTAIAGHVDGLEGKDYATQTTLAAVLAKIIPAPATEAKQDTEIAAVNRIGTRSYGTVERVGVGAGAAQSAAIVATEVLLHASVKCYVLVGAGTPAPTASTGIPLEAGEKFHMRIASGHKIGVIRDAEDGFLHVVAVA